jgi:hypothetical protein
LNIPLQEIKHNNETDKLKLQSQELQAIAKTEGDRDIQGSKSALAERKTVRDKALKDYQQGTVTEEAKVRAAMKEATTKLTAEYNQVLQTLHLNASESAASIEADANAKVGTSPARAAQRRLVGRFARLRIPPGAQWRVP